MAFPPESALTDTRFARIGYEGVATLFLRKTRYLITLETDFVSGKVNGAARILFVNSTPDSLVNALFRLYPNHPIPAAYGNIYSAAKPRMIISSLKRDGVLIPVKWVDQYQTALEIPFATPLLPGGQAEIEVLYSIQYAAPSDTFDVRHAFPLQALYDSVEHRWRQDIVTKSLDYVVSEAGLFAVTLRTPKNLALHATGVITDVQESATQYTYQITTGPVRNFVFVLTRGWGVLPVVGSPVTLHLSYKGRREVAEEIQRLSLEAFQYFDQNFGPYLYARLTLLALVYPTGGEEYPTLLFIDTGRDTTYRRFITAHEVAHQWFYGVVGSDIARHAWLDESLAQIAMYLFYQEKYGNDVAEATWESILTWARRSKGAPRLIDTPVERFTDFTDYMIHTYGLGGLFMRQLLEKMGRDAFKKGLAVYYEAATPQFWGTPDLFYRSMQAQTSQPLNVLFCQQVGIAC
jgi:hypothetical protein